MIKLTALLLSATLTSAAVVPIRRAAPQDGPHGSHGGGPSEYLSGGVDSTFGRVASMLLGSKTAARQLAQSLPETKLATREVLQPRIRPDAKRVKVRYGPIELVSKNAKKPMGETASLDPHGQAKWQRLSNAPCNNCTMLGGRSYITLDDGSSAGPEQGIFIHHIFSFDMSKPQRNPIAYCDVAEPKKDIGAMNKLISPTWPFAVFLTRGEDNGAYDEYYTTKDGQYESGYHMGEKDLLVVQTDLVNFNDKAVNAYLTFEVEYLDGKVGHDAVNSVVSVTGCEAAVPKVSKTGPAETRSKKFPVFADTTLLMVKGHLHDGGDVIIMNVNDKAVCTSYPQYTNGSITSMSTCNDPIKLKAGDEISVTTIYDLPKHPLRIGTDGSEAAVDSWGNVDVMGMFSMTSALDA